MINIIDFADLREEITQYIIENNYFSNYDIDTNDIVQMIIDVFSYITSTLSSSLVTAENNLLLYSSQDPDMIMNLLPLFGYSPNFGTPDQQMVNMYLTASQVKTIMNNTTIYSAVQQAQTSNTGLYFVILPQYSSINITSSVFNTTVTPISQASKTLPWMITDTVVVLQSDLYNAFTNGQACQLKTSSGNTSIPIIQQEQQTQTFSNVQGIPFEKFLIEENIAIKSLIINFDKLSTTQLNYNFNPSLTVSLNGQNATYNVYSSIIDSQGSSDNFVLIYYDPVSSSLYIQAGDNQLNGNILPNGQDITLTYYETYGNTLVSTPGSLNSAISIPSVVIDGFPFTLSVNLYQPSSLYGGILYNSINDIKQQALILGNINNRLVTKRDYELYVNYYLTSFMPYQYANCNVVSSFGENSIYILPIVSTTAEIYNIQLLSQLDQYNLNQVLTNISPMTTYVIVTQPTLYYLQTLPNTSINITVSNSISFSNIRNSITAALDNYFNINTFDMFSNFDVIDFTTVLNNVPNVVQLDYNSISNSLCLTTVTGSVVSYVDQTVSNSIIPLPSAQLNTYSVSNSSFQGITLTSSQLNFTLYTTNQFNQPQILGSFSYPTSIQ